MSQKTRGFNKIILIISISVVVLIVVAYVGYVYIQNQHQEQIKSIVSDFNKNNLDDAITKAQEMSKDKNTEVQGLLLLATAYEQKGSLEFKEKEYGDLAIQAANKVLAIDPNNAEAYRLIGYAYEIEQNYTDAIYNYNKSISLNTSNAPTLANRGHAYYLMGKIDEATNDFNAALKIDQSMYSAWLNLARISSNNGDNEKANEFLSKISVEKLPVFLQSEYYILNANLKKSVFNIEGALSDFNKALDLQPNSPYLIVNVVGAKMLLLLKGDKTLLSVDDANKFTDEVNRAISINPNQTIAYITLGNIKIYTNDPNGAMEQYKKAKEVLPNDITLSAEQKKITSDSIDRLLDMKFTKIK